MTEQYSSTMRAKRLCKKMLFKIILCLVILAATYTLYRKTTQPHKSLKTSTFHRKSAPRLKGEDDISCHYITEGDALPSAEDPSFSPPADSIFFHETSCRGNLNSRQACCIEAAAKTHPWKNIYVLFSAPVTENILYFTQSSIFQLRSYPNIIFARVHIDEYAKGTALEPLLVKRVHNSSHWKVVHTSDMLRFLTLYKYGGLYLDTDVIVVKSMDDLGRNWVARESESQVNNAVVNVATDELGRGFVRNVLEEISTSYKPDQWSYNGPLALNRVLSKLCNTYRVQEFSRDTCKGFQVYDQDLIYPVPYSNFEQLLKTGDLVNNKAYCFHLWNKLSHGTEVQFESPFDKLAKQHCPVIHELYGDSFGY